jgi:hypothetical protein
MALRAPEIRLDIERIVLDGLPHIHRERFLHAFVEACTAGLAETRFENAASVAGRLDVTIAHDANAEAIGRALARGIVDMVSRT